MMTIDQFYQKQRRASIIKGKESRDAVIKKFNLQSAPVAVERSKVVKPYINRNGIPNKIVDGRYVPLKRIEA